MTAEVAAKEGEVREAVFVADLFHRFRRVLDGRFELQYEQVVDNLLGATPVIHAAYAAKVLRTDVEQVGIGLYGMQPFAMFVDE